LGLKGFLARTLLDLSSASLDADVALTNTSKETS
jgi:hypothetical protein